MSAPLETVSESWGADAPDWVIRLAEDCVRGVFMNGTVECPALGSIPSNECHDWRKKSRQFGNANMLRVRMFRACNHCPRNMKEAKDG